MKIELINRERIIANESLHTHINTKTTYKTDVLRIRTCQNHNQPPCVEHTLTSLNNRFERNWNKQQMCIWSNFILHNSPDEWIHLTKPKQSIDHFDNRQINKLYSFDVFFFRIYSPSIIMLNGHRICRVNVERRCFSLFYFLFEKAYNLGWKTI